MKVSQLYEFLNERIPRALSCEWDNDGLACCPDPEKQVCRVLLALDITREVVDKAVDEGYDVILAHHPLIFRPIKALTTDLAVPGKLIRLVENKISAMAFPTRLDAVDGGVNDVLAQRLGLSEIEKFGPEGEMMGRVGRLPASMSLEDFAAQVKCTLGAPFVLANGDRTVSRVAVVGGNGDDFIGAAIAAGADTYVSGRLGYHPMTDARESGINLVEAGHFYTEAPVLAYLESLIQSLDNTIETTVFDSNRIVAI